MHEMALCTDVMDVVLSEAKQVNAVEVKEVHLVIGEVRDVVEDLFLGFFHHLGRNTIAENARVVFSRVPLTIECHQCGQISPVNVDGQKGFECPSCSQKDYEVKTGMEFFIGSMDVVTEEELCAAAS